jgi:hypothetical protein
MTQPAALVVTSIARPNDVLKSQADGARRNQWPFYVIGDASSPSDFSLPGARFLSVQDQIATGLAIAAACPLGHYARKNIGFLLAMRDGASVIVESDDDNRPLPAIAFEFGYPAVFHADWARVERRNPAHRGEIVIAKMMDLGETQPSVPKDQPFPDTPFLEVASPVHVNVDGLPAEVSLKIGWPNMVNRYRVDFQIPENVRPGAAVVAVTSGSATGPPIPVAVR